VFETDLIKGALVNAMQKNKAITDDCSAVELLRVPVCLTEGDEVKLFLPDDVFAPVEKEDLFLKNFRVHLHILYEDENLLLADKKPGLMSHPDDRERVNTLLTHIHAYLYQKGEYDSMKKGAFAPALCNRIDRFTGGIVIAAKNEPTLKLINAKIAAREIQKFYLCAVHGALNPQEGLLKNFLLKPQGQRSVQIFERPVPGAQEAETGYRTLAACRGLTLVECELYTGRTHQIRAQMAHAGHPLLGDSQYGDKALDGAASAAVRQALAGRARTSYDDERGLSERSSYNAGYQALYAYRVDFGFQSDAGHLNYLRGRSFRVGRVAFADTLFPGFHL
ncbi:MAG: pseudouridine synthase, partial [Eubacteriales bacterium]|nr:pseudouridine synthase [Eubacteriales bacterium]